MKKKRFFASVFLVFLFSLLSLFSLLTVQGAETDLLSLFQEINMMDPTFHFEFNEEIIIKTVNLSGITEQTLEKQAYFTGARSEQEMIQAFSSIDELDLFDIIVTQAGSIVDIKPEHTLLNGAYAIQMIVSDHVGNEVPIISYYLLNETRTDILIIDPRVGVSNGNAVDLVIETRLADVPEPAACKLSASNPLYNFDSAALIPFDEISAGNAKHTMKGFFQRAAFVDSAEFFIICKDSRNSVVQKMVEIFVDTTPPTITAFEFKPPKVVEYDPGGVLPVVLFNITANEEVLCRYSLDNDAEYLQKIPFDGFAQYDFDAYKKSQTVKFTVPSAALASYTIYAECENRAGWGAKALRVLSVDFDAPIGVKVTAPARFIETKTNLNLVVTTDKTASCSYTTAQKTTPQPLASLPGRKEHTSPLPGPFVDGSYSYAICCKSGAGASLTSDEECVSHTFTVDTSAPAKTNITGPAITCSKTKFDFRTPLVFWAEDPHSGIDYYLYQLKDAKDTLLNWTRSDGSLSSIDEDSEGNAFNLSNATAVKYTLNVKAINNAGQEGTPASKTLSYAPGDFECKEHIPPTLTYNLSNGTGSKVLQFFCTDNSGCNNGSLYYGTAGNQSSCKPVTNIKGPPFKEIIREPAFVCYTMADVIGNNASGTIFVNVSDADSCKNEKKDRDETDIDCGGSCSKGCDLDDHCNLGADCKSDYCDAANGLCSEPSCEDEIMNGDETDIDCGGACETTCDMNQSCEKNSDCTSLYCTADTKICSEASCDDGIKNGGEEDIDCGGTCDVDCDDKDGDGIDDVWEDEYCDGDCDPDEDLDGDGLKNYDEFRNGTDPTKADTDGDGFNDREELEADTDPNDPEDYPHSPLSWIFILLGLLLIVGGTGYLVYKKYQQGAFKNLFKSEAHDHAVQRNLTPQQIAAQKRAIEERQKAIAARQKAMLEQRKKLAEAMKHRKEKMVGKVKKISTEKRSMREQLFSAFGTKKPAFSEVKKSEINKTEIKKDIVREKVIPSTGFVFKPKPRVEEKQEPVYAGKEEWVSFDDLGEKEQTAEVAKKEEEKTKIVEKKEVKKESSIFERLTKAAGKETGKEGTNIFNKLDEVLSRKKEAEQEQAKPSISPPKQSIFEKDIVKIKKAEQKGISTEKGRDIFGDLEKVAGKRTGDPFAGLTSMRSKKDSNPYDELRKMVKSKKKNK